MNHGYLVHDTLCSVDAEFMVRPQMAAGHTVEEDGRLWTISLREGLRFHDGAAVLARDVAASFVRWARRDTFGQTAMAAAAEMRAIDDVRLRIRLHRPFPHLLDAMAKHIALGLVLSSTPASYVRSVEDVLSEGLGIAESLSDAESQILAFWGFSTQRMRDGDHRATHPWRIAFRRGRAVRCGGGARRGRPRGRRDVSLHRRPIRGASMP